MYWKITIFFYSVDNLYHLSVTVWQYTVSSLLHRKKCLSESQLSPIVKSNLVEITRIPV